MKQINQLKAPFLLCFLTSSIHAAGIMAELPWRVVDGKTNNVLSSSGWVRFSGTVLAVHPDGIRISGFYDVKGAADLADESEFFVANFPFQVAEGDFLSTSLGLVAKRAGVYTYPTVLRGTRTLHKLDFGIPCSAPAAAIQSPAQTRAAAQASLQKKADLAARTLKWHQALAAKGDPFGEFEMAKRYLAGDGVEKDPAKARSLLIAAAAQGHRESAALLSRLPQN